MKSTTRKIHSAIAVCLIAAAAPAIATIDVAIKGGGILPVSGEFHTAANNGVFTIQSKDISDIYDAFGTIGIEFVGHTGDSAELFAGFAYENGEAETLSVGTAPGLGGGKIIADFEDYTAYSFYAGARYYFNGRGAVSPFVSLVGGYKRVNEIGVALSIPDAGVDTGRVAFYDQSDVLFGGVDLGLRYQFSSGFSIIGEAGIRYQSELEQDDSAISTLGVGNLNDGDGFLTIPLTISANFTF